MASIGLLLGERWELVAPVGGGGMGTVWRARDRAGRADVAVKLMAQHVRGLASFEERFSREAIACEKVRHPNVVSVLGHGSTDAGEHYLVLELLTGESLGARLERSPAPLAREAVGWMIDALAGLEAVHAAGIVHRDLKPDNVFLSVSGDVTAVKLLDFGISRLVPPETAQWDSLTRSGEMLGTPVYMAPEQGRSAHHVDHRADLFSIGAMLYEALAGRPAFEGANVGEILLAVSRDEPSPLDQRLPGIGADMARTVERALAKSPEARFADARAMREALEAALPSVPADLHCGSNGTAEAMARLRKLRLLPIPAAVAPSTDSVRPPRRELPEDAGVLFSGESDAERDVLATSRAWVAVALALAGLLAVFVAYVVLGGGP